MVFEYFEKIEGKRWSLVQTRPRTEKYAAAHLEMNGVVVYLPLITKLEIHNRSKRVLYLPLFPGYVIACPNREEETIIRRDKCVWQLKILSEPDEEGLLRDLEIVSQGEILSQKQQLVVNPGLQIGETYIVKNGPFKGHPLEIRNRSFEVHRELTAQSENKQNMNTVDPAYHLQMPDSIDVEVQCASGAASLSRTQSELGRAWTNKVSVCGHTAQSASNWRSDGLLIHTSDTSQHVSLPSTTFPFSTAGRVYPALIQIPRKSISSCRPTWVSPYQCRPFRLSNPHSSRLFRHKQK